MPPAGGPRPDGRGPPQGGRVPAGAGASRAGGVTLWPELTVYFRPALVRHGAPKRQGDAMTSWAEIGRRGRHGIMACAVLAAGCTAMSQAPSLGTIAERMPREMAGFVLGETAERPGPSLALDYATPSRSAVGSVLIYAAAGAMAPADPAAPAIDRELTAAVAELSEAPQGRTGRRLAERERMTLAAAGLRCAIMTGAFGRAPMLRQVCIGGADGRFVKIQVTMADARPRPADATAFATAALGAVRGG